MGLSRYTGGRKRGVALLMTLSMLLLISVALMKVFEKRALETAHLSNTLNRFQAETLARSIYRAVLIAIRDKGLVAVIGNRALWQAVPFTLENATFRILEIKPADSRFNLNAKITAENARSRRELFYNLVSRLRQQTAPELHPLLPDDVVPALSAITDFTDPDHDPDPVFLYDHEYYPRAEPAYAVKNREFDRVSEVRLLTPFRELGIASVPLEDYFRVHGDLTVPEFIDINLAQKGETAAFLELFQNVPGYESAYANRAALEEIVTGEDNPTLEDVPSLKPVEPRFPPANFHHRIESRWNEQLTKFGITLEPKELDLFRPATRLLSIKLSVEVGNVTVRVNSLLQLIYHDEKKSLDIRQIQILTFSLM